MQRGGSCGTGSVNVSAGQSFPAHFIRRLTRQKSVSCPQARTSRGVTVTYWCTFSETVPQPGHIAGRVILAQTVRPAAGPALRFRHFHAVHPEQHRRRILGRRRAVILDRHKSGSSGPHPHIQRTDTRRYVTD